MRANGGHPIALYPGRPLAKISLRPDPVLLFRYSTVTFNGHRIHYDRSYATSTEGSDDLVVHGPMQATWMLNMAAQVLGACPSRFTCWGVSPLTCGQPVQIEAHEARDGSIALRVLREEGPEMMTGIAYVWRRQECRRPGPLCAARKPLGVWPNIALNSRENCA